MLQTFFLGSTGFLSRCTSPFPINNSGGAFQSMNCWKIPRARISWPNFLIKSSLKKISGIFWYIYSRTPIFHLYLRITFKERWNHIRKVHLGPQNIDLHWWGTLKSGAVIPGFHCMTNNTCPTLIAPASFSLMLHCQYIKNCWKQQNFSNFVHIYLLTFFGFY